MKPEYEVALVILAFILLFLYRIIRHLLKYPSLIIVGIDIDGVLGEQVPPTLDRIRKKGIDTKLTKKDIINWDFKDKTVDISKEIEEALLDPTFVSEMPVVIGSISAMKQLQEDYHLVVATARPLETLKATKNWLKKNFNFHEFVFTREVGKTSLSLNILIDDNFNNVTQFASSCGNALLFSQPWNQNIENRRTLELMQKRRIIRCENWEEVLTTIKALAKRL